MKHSIDGSTGLFARRLRSGAAGIAAALMMAALAPPAAAQGFRAPNVAVNQGETAVFTITLPSRRSHAVRYAYRTLNNGAKAGIHYEGKSGHVVFPAGTRKARVKVKTYRDRLFTNATTFYLELSGLETQLVSLGGSPYWAHFFRVNTGDPMNLPPSKTVVGTIRAPNYQSQGCSAKC